MQTATNDEIRDGEYREAIRTARQNLDEVKATDGANLASGDEWEAYRREHFTAEQNAAADIEAEIVAAMIKARHEKGYSQQALADAAHVKQPMIARLERQMNSPRMITVLRMLSPLGLKLAVVPK